MMTCGWFAISSRVRSEHFTFPKNNFKSSGHVDVIVTSTDARLKLMQAGKCVMHVEFNGARPLLRVTPR